MEGMNSLAPPLVDSHNAGTEFFVFRLVRTGLARVGGRR